MPPASVPGANREIVAVFRAGRTAEDITPDTAVIPVILPNRPGVGTREWLASITSVDAVERSTGYDFFKNVPPMVEREIEAKVRQVL